MRAIVIVGIALSAACAMNAPPVLEPGGSNGERRVEKTGDDGG